MGSSVGVFLDENYAYVLNARGTGKDLQIMGYSEVDFTFPSELSDTDKKNMRLQALKDAFDRANVKTRSVSLAVPGDVSMTRFFYLPVLPKKEEENAVRFEAQKYVPFDIRDLYFAYHTFADPKLKKMGVVFLAARKNWIDEACADLLSIGYKAERAELVSQAIARAYHAETSGDAEGIQILVDAGGAEAAELIISKGPSVLMTRHLSLTAQSNSSEWDIPMLISEIRISFDHFTENFKDRNISKIAILSDGTGSAKKLEEVLRKEFQAPVESIDLLASLKSGATHSTGRIASYGLLAGTRRSDRLNLLSAESIAGAQPAVSWDEEKKSLQEIATKSLLGVIASLALIFFLLNQIASQRSSDVHDLMARFPKVANASIEEPLDQLKTRESEFIEKNSFASNFFDKRTFITGKLNALPRILPTNVFLTQLRYEDSVNNNGTAQLNLRMEGYVTSPEAGTELSSVNKMVSQFTADKEFMSGFDDIKISSAKRVTYKGTSATRFGLECINSKKG